MSIAQSGSVLKLHWMGEHECFPEYLFGVDEQARFECRNCSPNAAVAIGWKVAAHILAVVR